MISRTSQLIRHVAASSSVPPLSALALLPRSRARPQTHGSRPHFGGGTGIAAMASVVERQRRTIQTAACLIIGDEVLGGKTVDTNSNFLAKWCFKLGLRLKKIEVVEDDEADIIDAVRRLSSNYDFVVTSGGIGSTHDDITYPSIAKAFGLPLKLHQEAFEKMKRLSKPHPSQPNFNWHDDSPDLRARLRMVHLPTDESRSLDGQFLFVSEELWVPIAVVNGNVHILPGIPRLFQELLQGIKPYILPRLVDPEGKGSFRVIIETPYAESKVAEYLTELAARVEPQGVKVGSYPRWGQKNNTVTLVGKDEELLEKLALEVEKNVEGKRSYKTEESDDESVEKKTRESKV